MLYHSLLSKKGTAERKRQKIKSRKWGSYLGSPYIPSSQLFIDPEEKAKTACILAAA
jgi:hypothetical protein